MNMSNPKALEDAASRQTTASNSITKNLSLMEILQSQVQAKQQQMIDQQANFNAFRSAMNTADLLYQRQHCGNGKLLFGAASKDFHPYHRQNQQTSNEEALVKTIPCRARGMSVDHNSSNAYFKIRKHTMHGEPLFCSHPLCREVGIKFYFCAYCKDAVAKRKFRQSHMKPHCSNEVLSGLQLAKKEINEPHLQSRKGQVEAVYLSDSNISSMNSHSETTSDDDSDSRKRSKTGPHLNWKSNNLEVMSENLLPLVNSWVKVLYTRPKDMNDKDAWRAWMLQAMHVSQSLYES